MKTNDTSLSFWRIFGRRLVNLFLTLLVIAFLTLLLQTLAERGRAHLPAQPLSTLFKTIPDLFEYIFLHPRTYAWQRQDQDAFQLVLKTFTNSAGLLLVAMAFASFAGVVVGFLAARTRSRLASSLVLVFSILGMSTPSFIFAMLMWVINIQVINRFFELKALPPTGFGWDLHLLMPALVLAARPFAQIAQITYISLRDILKEDFIRTAHAKGLSNRLVYNRHALRNILIPVLTTIGTSLRYSIASLPVVEFFFLWPGIGLTLLQAIGLGNSALVTDLIVSLGIFFVIFNLALDLLYPFIDARLRKDSAANDRDEPPSWSQLVKQGTHIIQGLITRFKQRRWSSAIGEKLPDLPENVSTNNLAVELPAVRRAGFRQIMGWFLYNPALIVGVILVILFFFVMVLGANLVPGNPYEMTGITKIEGVISAPPFQPSSVFPWGSDHLGRDIQALVFEGGQRTLTLAFLIMIARLVIGSLLGIISGWWADSAFDRLIQRLLNIWAAFPMTLFALMLIQALGIEQGVWVFVVALCVVGWGEVTQFVRSQTIRIRPALFIEAARSLGASSAGILVRQVFPNLVSSLLVIASLEMGGILMLLAELGFLNIFLGGGFQVELTVDRPLMFSDIPEWGALLANVRDWWRSYPWMAWYPGFAFFLSILTFNLFGDGLRRFLEDSRTNLSRLFNRFTFSLAALGGLILALVLSLQSPLGIYSTEAKKFNELNVLSTIADLTNPIFLGREAGGEQDKLIADYLSTRMKDIGLFPPDGDGPFTYTVPVARLHLIATPSLDLIDETGQIRHSFVFRQDFRDYGGPEMTYGDFQGQIVGLGLGPPSGDGSKELGFMSELLLSDKVLLIREKDYDRPGLNTAGMLLVIADDSATVSKKNLYFQVFWRGTNRPVFWVDEKTADLLLFSTGSSLAELDQRVQALQNGEVFATNPGAIVSGSIQAEERVSDQYHMVIGVIPGEGALVGKPGGAMDTEVTIVSAYYDGLGNQPDGVIFPGANDNASGVGTLLEVARLMKNSPYMPKRTIIFVAWSGGERGEPLVIQDFLGAYRELSGFTINEVIEISGVGAGTGKAVTMGAESSYRLVKLIQDAGKRLNVKTTTRGRGPHIDLVPEVITATKRDVPSLYLSWDGADVTAHSIGDTLDKIDPEKLKKSGRLLTLALLMLSRETGF